MVTGEKNIEFRRIKPWILNRLVNKSYDTIKFTNGYGKERPHFICEFKGWNYAEIGVYKYSNGLIVNTNEDYVEIYLGKILSKHNVIPHK